MAGVFCSGKNSIPITLVHIELMRAFRMFTGSLVEETKVIEEDIEAVKAKVEDPMICEKVRLFVYAPREIQAIFKADAGTLEVTSLG